MRNPLAIPATSAALVVSACSGSTEPRPGAGSLPIVLSAATENDLYTGDLYLASDGGPTLQPLTSLPGAEVDPRWSPNGQLIAFRHYPVAQTVREIVSDVWVIRADGTGLRRLTTDGGNGSPGWTGDGRVVFPHSTGGGAAEWRSVRPDGSDLRTVTLRAGQQLLSPDWSRDGTRLAYIAVADGTPTVYVAAPDGGGERAVVTGLRPRWAPNSRTLAFATPLVTHADGVRQQLATVSADGGASAVIEDLTVPGSVGPYSSLTWSSDGARVAYIRRAGTELRAYVVGANGTGARRLTSTPPTGTWIEISVDWRPTS